MLGKVTFALCGYEAIALVSHRRVPTITFMVWRCRSRGLPIYAASVAVVLTGLAVAAHHLLVEGDF